MEVDILIDKLTDCLVERASGEIVETEYKRRITPIKMKEYKGWNFSWNEPEKTGYTVYELFLKDDDVVQGRVAVKIDGGAAEVSIVESAPHNVGRNGKYEGVGGHLFAIACKVSLENGCDGFVAFTAKNRLIDHYMQTLDAKIIGRQRMYIDDVAAHKLIEQYLER